MTHGVASRLAHPTRSWVLEPASRAFLPCLYYTRTILRGYSTTQPFYPLNPSSAHPTRVGPGRNAAAPRNLPNRTTNAKEDYVPFDDDTGTVKGPLDLPMDSTVTPKERRAFQQLLSRRVDKAKETTNASSGTNPSKPSSIDAILIDALSEHRNERESRRRAKERDKPERERTPQPGTLVGDTMSRESAIVKFEDRLRKAGTDVEVWNILDEEVFTKLRELKLDEVPSDVSRRGKEAQKDLKLFQNLLPSLLIDVITQLRDSFPGSQLAMSVLPTLRKIGPSAFALGASTQLYNEQMRMLFTRFFDLAGVLETLEQMESEVYQFDEDTAKLLTLICETHRVATKTIAWKGPEDGMVALWSTERKKREKGKIHVWRRIIDERLETEALRKAQERTTQAGHEEAHARIKRSYVPLAA